MTIFIDFDDVLFNTKRFRDDLQNLFFQHGINREIFEKYYFSNSAKNNTYDPWGHIELIEKGEKIYTAGIKKALEDFMTDTNPYLFDDSVDFLKSFDKDFVCVVSYGELKFQSMKIGECRVGKYCKEIRITNELKSQTIENFLNEENNKDVMFFIEDRVEHINDVKKKFPFIKTILMRRLEGRYHDDPTEFCDHEAKSLKEAEEIIRSLK